MRTHFAKTYTVIKPVRIKTASTALTFYDPLSNSERGNDMAGQWVTVLPGTVFYLVSKTDTPDQATLLMEVRQGKKKARSGVVLRKFGWDQLMSGSVEGERELTAQQLANTVPERRGPGRPKKEVPAAKKGNGKRGEQAASA